MTIEILSAFHRSYKSPSPHPPARSYGFHTGTWDGVLELIYAEFSEVPKVSMAKTMTCTGTVHAYRSHF